MSECPVEAIYHEDNVPDEWREYIALNAEMAKVCRPIVERKPPLGGSGEAEESRLAHESCDVEIRLKELRPFRPFGFWWGRDPGLRPGLSSDGPFGPGLR